MKSPEVVIRSVMLDPGGHPSRDAIFAVELCLQAVPGCELPYPAAIAVAEPASREFLEDMLLFGRNIQIAESRMDTIQCMEDLLLF